MSSDKQERILEAATIAFTQYGFRGTTIESVAKIAKVGKGTVYTFFTSKEELFQAILEQNISQMIYAANEVKKKQMSLCQSIPATLEKILEFRTSHQFFIKIIQEARDLQTVQVLESVEKMDKVIIDYIEQLVQEETEKGEQTTLPPRVIAFLVYKVYLLLIFEWERHHVPLDMATIASILQRQVF